VWLLNVMYLREEYKYQVVMSKMLRKIFQHKRDEVSVQFTVLYGI